LIAQDSTRYGIDIYGESRLIELLQHIDKVDGDFLYRVLYLYPDLMTFNNLETLTTLDKFIPYFDVPLQHINPELLQRM